MNTFEAASKLTVALWQMNNAGHHQGNLSAGFIFCLESQHDLCLHRKLGNLPLQVGEALLFGGLSVPSELRLAICQWPRDQTKLLVYGSRYWSTLHFERKGY